ncbi:flavin-containing monooxygenase [Altererythrobacter litoralis]|uniref:NAD(P)/FAD-dependent oxidoreductase n=1 Tax=Altererythrobacter litoralis TaxID=3113904 RepID=A0ABU7GEN1_9SPHN|nr:NAD(P)/FAD-dependent oxidoreductase [Erythrobacteraceae bacterium 1XM1-14]
MAEREFDAIVVGAGFSGLYMLHKLRGLGFTAKVIEAADDVGGTWYWNRYPGARCDIESYDYSYSFDEDLQQEWAWSERYAPQPEILRYLQHVAERFDLRRDIQFETRVERAVWNDDAKRWTIETDRGDSFSARFCIMGTGCLSSFNRPDIPGLDDFAGPVYLTGQWPHEGVDFTGQRVAVIGTGSSSVQSTPIIAKQAERLTIFQRTPNYVVPAHNYAIPPEEEQAIKANYAQLRATARESAVGSGRILPRTPVLATKLDEETFRADMERRYAVGGLIGFTGAYADITVDPAAAERMEAFIAEKIREGVDDPETAEKLIPRSHHIMTKRLCVDIGYYENFNRDNVELVDIKTTPIERIEAHGLRTSERFYEADALVLATGFDAMTGSLERIEIRGKGNQTLAEKWAAGPITFLGLMSAGFPNLFLVTGPGSPSVLTNMVSSIEQHVDYIADVMVMMRDRGAQEFEPLPACELAWVEHNNSVAATTTLPDANSWYMGANIPGKPRVMLPYFGGFPAYRNICDEIASECYSGFSIDGQATACDVDFEDHVMRLMPEELAEA